jgi:hypothetical protein
MIPIRWRESQTYIEEPIMPLSDLFKKPAKKEPVKENPFGSPEMQKKRYEAAMEFVKAFQEKTPLVDGKPHAGTVLAAAARLAGSSLYRSLHSTNGAAPGVVVLSDKVNEAWPQLMKLFAFYCKQHGLDVLSKPVVTTFPERDRPRMDVAEILTEYQDEYREIMKKHGLDYLDGARAGMIVCSVFFEYLYKTARDIDPSVAAGIVSLGIVEGAKTAPPPLGSRTAKEGTMNTPAKNNDRLVLGDRDAAIQEALDNGGAFIDVNPEILRMLKENNIDPYLVYEKALLQNIEGKVSRIDFVQADVDRLFEEWRSKPEGQAPVHVRLILWLKQNARAHGYEQSGNSWIRKG